MITRVIITDAPGIEDTFLAPYIDYTAFIVGGYIILDEVVYDFDQSRYKDFYSVIKIHD